MENRGFVGMGGNRIRELERGCGAKQIEGVSVRIERGGGLLALTWRPGEEERAWAWAWAWGPEEAVVMVRRAPWECGCG